MNNHAHSVNSQDNGDLIFYDEAPEDEGFAKLSFWGEQSLGI
ncbi:hypothetical protein [[Limnothrix rosea] IAM M-220]|nr:hypothetical protein [[Limnothrix rosea] IAM M-220]